jgi:hypothetical protein
MSPLQKWESFGFDDTCMRILVLKYLFLSKDCQVPSVFKRFTNHLANRHLFCSCKFKIPRPPWSLGRHKMSYLASLYLCLIAEPCQKNLDLKWSRFLKTLLGTSRKDIMNMGKLLNTEFSITNLPPIE